MNGRRAREQRRPEHRHPACRSGQRRAESSIVNAQPEEVRAALESLSPELPWLELRDSLRPVFMRRRPLPPGMAPPLVRHMPVGVDVALGADIGPAFLYIAAAMLESWSVSQDEAFDVAFTNLRAVVDEERYFEMAYEPIDGIPVWWYQSRGGLASGLLLLEDILAKRYGDQPRVLMAPMRNLLLAAPYDADREVLEWLCHEISHADPNGLDLPIFTLVDGRLAIDEPARRPRKALVH